MPQTVVTLNEDQMEYAHRVAYARQKTAPAKQAHGCIGGLPEHLSGAYGETAFALWCYGPSRIVLTIGTYRRLPDFPRTEVRTRSRPDWDLIVRADDNPQMAYVLVVPFGAESWRLAGWCYGDEARQDKYQAEHGGRERAWFVPQSFLRSMLSYRYLVLGGR